jgi:RNA polymerase subunit RPABC4/transcription elongation factor Spt4
MRNRIIQNYLYAVEDAFTELQRDHRRPKPPGKVCSYCRSIKPQETKMCHSCRSRDFEPILCTTDSRIAKFLDMLVSCGLWPVNANMHGSILTISSRIRDGIDELHRRGVHMHNCEYGVDCHIHTVLSAMIKDLQKVERDIQAQEEPWGDMW